MRAIPRRWTNSKGINFENERSETRAMNYLRKEAGIFTKKDNNKKNNSYKKPYKQKQR